MIKEANDLKKELNSLTIKQAMLFAEYETKFKLNERGTDLLFDFFFNSTETDLDKYKTCLNLDLDKLTN